MIPVFLGLFIALLIISIPFLIVGFWQKHPRIALVVASLLAVIIMALPGLIQTLQAMMVYGTGDPELMAGGISQAITGPLVWMVVVFPLLHAFQKIMRSRRQSKSPKN